MKIMWNMGFSRLRASAACALAVLAAAGSARAELDLDQRLMEMVETGAPAETDFDGKVLDGFRLFTRETFGGNGRTCGTCHPPEHNFTIDPEFISRLPRGNPLFVAEFDPNLRALEVPVLMRRFGLILENLDTFDHPGVLRSVPHILGMRKTLKPEEGFPLAEATGWSGDGAPFNGSLRHFTVGAVAQHLTRTLAREGCSATEFRTDPEGCDFRVPTEAELDALLAFQMFVGRHDEPKIDPEDPAAIAFTDPAVEQGRLLFHEAPTRAGDTRSCSFCHHNGGGNDSDGRNRQFATGANRAPNAPACLRPGRAPGDGGFGVEPVVVKDSAEICGGGRSFDIVYRGDDTMNTPSLIEAADTPPFFHNSIAATIEESVEFYTTDAFHESPAGDGRAFVLKSDETNAMAALLRALNALENIRSGDVYSRLALRSAERSPDLALELAALAKAETGDAIEVLTEGPLELFGATDVRQLLGDAHQLERQATEQRDLNLLELAIAAKGRARDQMLVPTRARASAAGPGAQR